MEKNMIYYTIDRRINSRMSIKFQDGEVVVKAPWYVRKNTIRKKIEEKRNWIFNKLKEYEDIKTETMHLRPITIFGEIYTLKVTYKNIDKIECNLVNNNMVEVNFPKKYKNMNNELITNVLIDRLYEKIAQKELDIIMEKLRINLGIAPEDFKIMEMKDCIATCTEDKKIIVNPRIVRYDKKTIEYILLHQFCHLKYKTHAKSFWNMIEKYMPDYKKYEINDIKY